MSFEVDIGNNAGNLGSSGTPTFASIRGIGDGKDFIPASAASGFEITSNYMGGGEVDFWSLVNNEDTNLEGFMFLQKSGDNTVNEIAHLIPASTYTLWEIYSPSGKTATFAIDDAALSGQFFTNYDRMEFQIGAGGPTKLDYGTTTAGIWTFAATITPSAGMAAAGGFGVSPRLVHTGGTAAFSDASSYTVQTPVVTEFYYAEIFIPANMSITGIAVFNSGIISGNMKVGLADSSGNILKTSASTVMSGTTTYQRIAFSGGVYLAVGPATYYICTFYDNTAVRPNTFTIGNFSAGKITSQAYATGFTDFSPTTTFTAALGPVASLY